MSRSKHSSRTSTGIGLLLCLAAVLLTSCARVDPRQVEVELPHGEPMVKRTSFDRHLADLGRMSVIYGKRVRIQGKDIADETGTSKYGFGEIPRDITEMTKSALNAIGGNVLYIPYNPVFINNEMVTGYSSFQGKIIPDVVLSGGITEFDRGLETRGRNTDFGVTTKPFNVNDSWVPGDTISLDYSQGRTSSLARITLDFNLIDFKTMAGVPRMQTVNSINVYKAVAEKELGFTIFGPSFGLKGTVKKVQGRHAAIRLLVQASVLQVVGKYLGVPYWRLLPGAAPDPVVINRVRRDFLALDPQARIRETQVLLFMKGHDVAVDGRMGPATRRALHREVATFPANGRSVSPETYIALWQSLADDLDLVMARRTLLARRLARRGPRPQKPGPSLRRKKDTGMARRGDTGDTAAQGTAATGKQGAVMEERVDDVFDTLFRKPTTGNGRRVSAEAFINERDNSKQ